MHSTIKDTLGSIDFPFLILVNSTPATSAKVEQAISEKLTGIDQLPPYTICLQNEADGIWQDTVLENLVENQGLLIIHSKIDESSISLQAGKLYPPQEITKLKTAKGVGSMLHARCAMLSDISQPTPQRQPITQSTGHNTVTPDEESLAELSALKQNHCLIQSDNISLYLFKGREAPHLMKLIGVARAITFAAIGAGSGKDIDLSEEDEYYDHIMLWDNQAQTLAGAYRVGFTEEIINERGHDGLYLNHVFEFTPEYYKRLGNAMELSRSFILPAYQKNPQMLDALWKAIGRLAVKRNCFTLFGSVTISDAFTPLSQAILVDTLDRHHGDIPELRNCVSSRHPFQPTTQYHSLVADAWSERGMNKLNSIIEEVENGQRSTPPLARYYVSLGAKFLAFQVEPTFNNAIYCLLRVDLNQFPRRYKKRFLGITL